MSVITLEKFEEYLQQWAVSFYHEPSPLHRACQYALSGGGKRLRPQLVLLCADLFGGNWESALGGAIAIEMVHTYSLIHDDLPCMDDDALRRGRPTTHIAFNEATALLAGDALLTDAFTLVADADTMTKHLRVSGPLSTAQRLSMLRTLAQAAGGEGMVLGQDLDLYWTDRGGGTLEDLNRIHQLKTGRLIRAACSMGAIVGSAVSAEAELISRYGHLLGLCFQVTDDLLDLQANTGKSAGKDEAQNKLTYVTLLGEKEATLKAQQMTDEALEILNNFGPPARALADLTRALLQRRK